MRTKKLLWQIHKRVEALGHKVGVSSVPFVGPLAHGLFYFVRDWVLVPRRPADFVSVRGFTLRLITPTPVTPVGAADFLHDSYEPEVTSLFESLLRPGMTVVDVGSSVGYYTLLSAKAVGNTGKVYSFEPEPISYELLVKNVMRNGFTNVVAVPKAVTDKDGECELKVVEMRWGHVFTVALAEPGVARTRTPVPGTTLDLFFAKEGWPSVDLVKVDVDGGEKGVFDGMRELAHRNPGLRIVFEIDPESQRRAGISREDFFASLVAMGFTRFFWLRDGQYPTVPRDISWLWARGGNVLAERGESEETSKIGGAG